MSDLLQQHTTLQEQLQQLAFPESEQQFLIALHQSSGLLTTVLSGYGRAAYEALKQNQLKATAQSYLITFEWGEPAKAFLILLSQIIFEYQKAILLYEEQLIPIEKLQKLRKEAASTLLSAKDELLAIAHKIDISGHDRETKQKIKYWKLQQAPWPVYEEQLQSVHKQCIRLESEYNQMQKSLHAFAALRQLIHEDIESFLAILIENKEYLEVLREELEKIRNDTNYNQYESTDARLRHMEQKIRTISLNAVVTDKIEAIVRLFPENCSWVLEQQAGMMLFDEISLQRTLRIWLEEEILPLLNEIWELAEGSSNGLRMLIYNIGLQLKTALADKNKNMVLTFDSERNAIVQLCRDVSTSEGYINELKSLTLARSEEVLYLSTAFQKEQLFEGSKRNSRFRKYFWQSNRLLNVAQNWVSSQWRKLKNIRKIYQKEKKLSISEKTVRCVLSRKGDPENSHYTSIFLTKGNVGEQFTVGRKDDFAHASQIIEQWKQGYRGALLITGQRLSGKTLFAEILSDNLFHTQTIKISPNVQITYEGRKFNTEYDLGEALQFFKKYSLGNAPMLLIDDLELWHDESIPLAQNVTQLLRFVDTYSANCFVVVCLNNYTKAYLSNFFNIDKVFQAEISMDGISSNDIFNAISIRHRATHKKLVGKNEEKASDAYMKRLVRKINLKANGNIGEALTRWAFSTYKTGEETVESRINSYFHLPKFLDADTGLLLSTILLYKRINEKRLRKLFGEAFSEHYVHLIRRLLHVGILVRQLDGWLEIEPSIINDLGHMLEHTGFIKYTRKHLS